MYESIILVMFPQQKGINHGRSYTTKLLPIKRTRRLRKDFSRAAKVDNGYNSCYKIQYKGEVAEWSKAPVSKTGIRETGSRVRISPSPQIETSSLVRAAARNAADEWAGKRCRRCAAKWNGAAACKTEKREGFVPCFKSKNYLYVQTKIFSIRA